MKNDANITHPGLAGIGGLKIKFWNKYDPRHFSWKKKFGSIAALPTQDFDVWTPLETKDQGYTQVCTACMVTSAAEAQFKTTLDECFQFAATKALTGHVDADGVDPVDAIRAALGRGMLQKKYSPFQLGKTPVLTFADLANYPPETVAQAAASMETSYYVVDGQADRFDSIRAAMWQSLQGDFHTPIMVGAKWRASWMNSPGGVIIAENPQEGYALHAFEAIGQKTVNGELRIKAHLSNGTGIGDHGDFYFSRAQVNNFNFAYAFAPGDPQDYQVTYWNLAQKLWNLIWQLKKMLAGAIFNSHA